MSERHPIVAITGSSGAGTSTVQRTFEEIFRRESVTAAVIEGDSFHAYDRKTMREKLAACEVGSGCQLSHFGPEANLFGELENLFRTYAESGGGKRRKYLHSAEEAEHYKQEPGTFTPREELPAGTDLQVNLSAVIERKDGQLEHWTLRHVAAQPDFHARDTFVLTLATATHKAD